MAKIKRFNELNEGKREQDKIDELLDKGLKKLTPKEKDLLNYLSKGGLLEDEPKQDGIKLGGNIRDMGDKGRDFLNNLLGTNLGSGTQVLGVMPEGEYGGGEPPRAPKKPKKEGPKFNEGDKVTYKKAGSDNDGKSGTFLKIREEDGKLSLRFEDGKRFAALAKYVFPYDESYKKLDPYGEENWGNKPQPRRGAHPEDAWWNDGENPRDDYSMINQNNVPGDFYFDVAMFDNDSPIIALTSIEFFNHNHCMDDNLGSHALSRQTKAAMRRAGVFAEVEVQESEWEALPGFTVEQIIENMIHEGFVHGQEFVDFLNQHN